jgi:hypothetical protein
MGKNYALIHFENQQPQAWNEGIALNLTMVVELQFHNKCKHILIIGSSMLGKEET